MNLNFTNEPLIGPDRVLNVRTIPCSIKHGLIIRTFLNLAVGEHFILVNGHDPKPLFYQFSAEWPGTFSWEHLVRQPEEVHVKITKIKETVAIAEPVITTSCGAH